MSNKGRRKPTVVLDFDGVIHSYTSGWQGDAGVISDPPVEGIETTIKTLRERYRIVVVSSRCEHPGGVEAVERWLGEHDIEVDAVQSSKPPAIVYVDDRALTFDGDASALPEKIRNFKTWMQK